MHQSTSIFYAQKVRKISEEEHILSADPSLYWEGHALPHPVLECPLYVIDVNNFLFLPSFVYVF